MIDTVVSVKLPIGEMLRIKRNRLMPDVVTGEEKRICLVSGIYGDELGGHYAENSQRSMRAFLNLSLADSISAERSFAGSRQNLRI